MYIIIENLYTGNDQKKKKKIVSKISLKEVLLSIYTYYMYSGNLQQQVIIII